SVRLAKRSPLSVWMGAARGPSRLGYPAKWGAHRGRRPAPAGASYCVILGNTWRGFFDVIWRPGPQTTPNLSPACLVGYVRIADDVHPGEPRRWLLLDHGRRESKRGRHDVPDRPRQRAGRAGVGAARGSAALPRVVGRARNPGRAAGPGAAR